MKNEIYNGDFTGQDLSSHDPADFNNSEIVGSCFAQALSENEAAKRDIFPAGMTGVTFVKCNLDNVNVPDGNTIQGGSNRLIKVQNDLEDWHCFEDGTPNEPVSKKEYEIKGISIDPDDLPQTKLDIPVTQMTETELTNNSIVRV